ncbi:MAG TPA: ABC transporter substrate-binding protein [Candidatus Lustribacter sp.]
MSLNRSRALRVIGGAVAAPAIVAGFPALVRSQALTKLKLGIIPVDVAANAFYALDLGLFTKAGLDVDLQPMTSGPVLAQAVAGGAIDFGVSNVATIGAAHLRGLPFRFVAPAAVVTPGSKPTDVVMVAKDSTIRPGPSVNGKLIAINGLKDLQEIEAKGWVDKFGGDSSTIKFVEVPFPAMGGALEEKRCDIIFPTEPFSTADTNMGKVIGDAFDGIGPRFMLLGWFASESWLAKNAATATKFAGAMRQASEWANGHHAESAQMLVKHTKMSAEVASKIVRATYGLTLDPTMLTPVLNLALKYSLIAQPVAATDLIWKG